MSPPPKPDLGKRRLHELRKLIKHVTESAGQVLEHSEASHNVRNKILDDLRTAEYLFRRSLDNVERWAKGE